MQVRYLLLFTFAAITLLPLLGQAHPREVESETKYFIARIRDDPFLRNNIVFEQLRWSGIQDDRVYDPINELILERPRSIFDEDTTREISRLANILALSGMEKYRPTLQRPTGESNSKLLAMLNLQRHRNDVLQDGLLESPPGRLMQTRTINMLLSADPEMIAVSAKRVHDEFGSDLELLEAVNSSLLNNYNLGMKNDAYHDAMRRLIEALAASEEPSHQATLNYIAEHANSRKIARYAKRYR